MGKLDIAQVEIRVQKTLQNPIQIEHFLVICVTNCSIYFGKQRGFMRRFRLFIFLTFPVGKLDIAQVEIRVQKTLQNQIQMEHLLVSGVKNAPFTLENKGFS